jgi:hypothetical protein
LTIWTKIWKSYVLFSPIKDDKQILEPQEMWEKDETWIWILYKGIYKETYFHIQFYLHFILFDMKLISITMKMTLYLLRKKLPTVQYTWESVKFPTTLASCEPVAQSQIFGYNLRSLLKWYSVTYTSNTTVFKVRTVLCNNVKRLTEVSFYKWT